MIRYYFVFMLVNRIDSSRRQIYCLNIFLPLQLFPSNKLLLSFSIKTKIYSKNSTQVTVYKNHDPKMIYFVYSNCILKFGWGGGYARSILEESTHIIDSLGRNLSLNLTHHFVGHIWSFSTPFVSILYCQSSINYWSPPA